MAVDYPALRAEFVKEFKLEGLSEEKQDDLLGKMMDALMKRVFLDTIEKLGEQGAADYEALLEKGASDAEAAEFLKSRIPGYDDMVAQAVRDFKKEMTAAI
jgi:hypothetical protein